MESFGETNKEERAKIARDPRESYRHAKMASRYRKRSPKEFETLTIRQRFIAAAAIMAETTDLPDIDELSDKSRNELVGLNELSGKRRHRAAAQVQRLLETHREKINEGAQPDLQAAVNTTEADMSDAARYIQNHLDRQKIT